MEFRETVISELPVIMNIVKIAQDYLKSNGVDQWQNNYPDIDILRADIMNGNSYVLVKEDKIIATTALVFGEDNTYKKIYKGQWLNNLDYVVVHRIAVAKGYMRQGAACKILREVESLCQWENIKSIRIDTHQDNIPIQGLLEKNGFKYCGIIYLEDGSKRLAYEKLIKI